MINKENRKKLVDPSFHGSRSISNYRHQKTLECATKELYSQIETYKDLHMKDGKWVTPVCKKKYNEMMQKYNEKVSQSQSGAIEASGSSSPTDPTISRAGASSSS